MKLSLWEAALLALATARVTLGAVAALVGTSVTTEGAEAAVPTPLYGILSVGFGACALLLLWGGRSDRRAVCLGAVYLFTGSLFSDSLVQAALAAAPVLGWLGHMQPDAFLPYFLWRFADEFPRPSPHEAARITSAVASRVAWVVGAALFVANLALYVAPKTMGALAPLSRHLQAGWYWIPLFLFSLLALAFLLGKRNLWGIDERRRVRLFTATLVIGFLPVTTAGLAMVLSPAADRWLARPDVDPIVRLIAYVALLTVPMLTTYSVLVDRVLDLSLVVRRGLQYALARYAIGGLTVIPFGMLAALLWTRREEPLAELVADSGTRWLLSAVGFGVAGTLGRVPILDALDRRFFREQYNARQILAAVADRSRQITDAGALDELLRHEIDRALHLDRIGVLLRPPAAAELIDPSGRVQSLALSADLARLLEDGRGAWDTSASHPRPALKDLPADDRAWIADSGFRMLVPLTRTDGTLLGLIGLGDKRSELPFSREDHMLLSVVASAASLTLENRLLQARPARADAAAEAPVIPNATTRAAATASSGAGPSFELDRMPADLTAWQCIACGHVDSGGASSCSHCRSEMSPAPVPLTLAGKFRLQQCIGAGGMGVVYRAVDIDLARTVAIKVLPRAAPDLAVRLRREARAMAAISHPNLAMIYGAESWRGTPMLVVEYLAGGTLADRLATSAMEVEQVLRLGTSLADVTARLHERGILHRDIKPSNVGFTAEGIVKLLDLGLARAIEQMDLPEVLQSPERESLSDLQTQALVATGGGRVMGTSLYMSPEARAGESPNTSFDLWSLGVVLYESTTGRNPFLGEDRSDTLQRLSRLDVPDVRTWRPEAPDCWVEFLHRMLSRRRRDRPGSAREIQARIEEIGEILHKPDKDASG